MENHGHRFSSRKALILLFLWCAVSYAQNLTVVNDQRLFHRIAVGSCFNSNRGDHIFRLINEFHPNQFISLGDLIYADFHPKFNWKQQSNPDIIFTEYYKVTQTLPIWHEMFMTSNDSEEQIVFFNNYTTSSFLITFDDHDYGTNNGDKTFEYRNQSIDLFYHFFPHMSRLIESINPITGERVIDQKQGVFSSNVFTISLSDSTCISDEVIVHAENMENLNFTYKVILLDGRSNKDPKHTIDGDFLGVQQWDWLEKELHPENNVGVDLVLVGSAIQVLVNDKLIEENWGEFPLQRDRLLSLVSKLSLYTNVLFLSGDIHSAEVSQVYCPVYQNGELLERVTLMDITSSGLSHTFSKVTGPKLSTDDNASSFVVNQKSRGFYMEFLGELYQLAYPGHFRERGRTDAYGGLHFALLDMVKGPMKSLKLVLNVINNAGEVVITHTMPLTKKAHVNIDYNDLQVGECEPYWGFVPHYKTFVFRASMVIFGMIFVLFPACVILWLFTASMYYICFGQESKRRDALLRRYEKKHGVRAAGGKN